MNEIHDMTSDEIRDFICNCMDENVPLPGDISESIRSHPNYANLDQILKDWAVIHLLKENTY